jgi:hypothetical protein
MDRNGASLRVVVSEVDRNCAGFLENLDANFLGISKKNFVKIGTSLFMRKSRRE